jgi:hypothetical protein
MRTVVSFSLSHISVFNPTDPVGTLRNLTNIGSKEIISSLIDKLNMKIDGGQLI